MIVYFIRHGRPDYATDTLLPSGKRQALRVAERMKISGVDVIYSSSQGRAMETAQPLSEMLGLPIIPVDWARELNVESQTLVHYGVRRALSAMPMTVLHQKEYESLSLEESFEKVECFTDNEFRWRYDFIASGLDALLAENGYVRRPDGLYDIVVPNEKHIAVFCHGGMSRVIVSHLLHIPYQYVAANLAENYTGVTAFDFDARPDAVSPTLPYLLSYGDVGHLFVNGKPRKSYMTGEYY